MQELTTSLLGRACRIFMQLAYPDGATSVPPKKRFYSDLPADRPVESLLPPAECAVGIVQEMRGDNGRPCGYNLRLGSSRFPHLKLRLQLLKHKNEPTWVYMVDTHDGFAKDCRLPPPDHPDAKKWLLLQEANRILKEKIEAAFEKNGLATLNSILREELEDEL